MSIMAGVMTLLASLFGLHEYSLESKSNSDHHTQTVEVLPLHVPSDDEWTAAALMSESSQASKCPRRMVNREYS